MDDEQEFDAVNRPKHYNMHPSGVECIEITRHMVFNIGNAMKYLWRAGLKGDAIEDLKKAVFHINDEIDRLNEIALKEGHVTLDAGEIDISGVANLKVFSDGKQVIFDESGFAIGEVGRAGESASSWNEIQQELEDAVQRSIKQKAADLGRGIRPMDDASNEGSI